MDVRAYGDARGSGLTQHRLHLRGGRGATIAWGFRPIGWFLSWGVARDERGDWVLSGTLERREPDFFFRQRPLLFAVPRKGGHWTWEIRNITVGTQVVSATLGPMEA